MTLTCRLTLAAAAGWAMLHAQTFDSASIKTADPAARGYSIRPLPGRVSAQNATLRQLIAAAWHVDDFLIEGGPKWAAADRFDIEAKAPESPTPPTNKELMAMLQNLLRERFGLAVRRETKEVPVYLLEPSKSGPKLTLAKDTTAAPFFRTMQRRRIEAKNAPLDYLVEALTWILGRPVLDRTGLSGTYDYELEWSPDDLQLRSGESPVATDASVPSLGAALQEKLGLRLTSQRAPVPTVIIEDAHKPSEPRP